MNLVYECTDFKNCYVFEYAYEDFFKSSLVLLILSRLEKIFKIKVYVRDVLMPMNVSVHQITVCFSLKTGKVCLSLYKSTFHIF